MANINHELIADPYIHEPKGVSAASQYQVYTANGSGSGSWQKLSPPSFSGITSNGTAGQFLVADGSGGFQLGNSAYGMCYFVNETTPYELAYSATYVKVNPTTIASGIARDI